MLQTHFELRICLFQGVMSAITSLVQHIAKGYE